MPSISILLPVFPAITRSTALALVSQDDFLQKRIRACPETLRGTRGRPSPPVFVKAGSASLREAAALPQREGAQDPA